MLYCLAVLQVDQLDPVQWNNLYVDLPSKQTKVVVKDKSLIQCNDNEMEVVTPIALQHALNGIMGRVQQGRCFVRPSGTEDIVRIYAEALTLEGVEVLVSEATKSIIEIVG